MFLRCACLFACVYVWVCMCVNVPRLKQTITNWQPYRVYNALQIYKHRHRRRYRRHLRCFRRHIKTTWKCIILHEACQRAKSRGVKQWKEMKIANGMEERWWRWGLRRRRRRRGCRRRSTMTTMEKYSNSQWVIAEFRTNLIDSTILHSMCESLESIFVYFDEFIGDDFHLTH